MEEERNEERTKVLSKLPLFSQMSWAAIRSTVGNAAVLGFKHDDVVIQEGEVGDAIYVVESGRLQAYTRLESGVERAFAHYYDGDCFGEMALAGEPHWCSVRVLNDAILLKISRADFEAAIRKHPELGFRIGQILAHRLRDLRQERKRAKLSTAIAFYGVAPHTGKQMLAYNLAASLATETHEPVALLDLGGRSPSPPLPAAAPLPFQHHPTGFELLRATLPPSSNADAIAHLFSQLVKRFNYVLWTLPDEFGPAVQQCLIQADRIFLTMTPDEERTYRARLFLSDLRDLCPSCLGKLQVMAMHGDVAEETAAHDLARKLGHTDVRCLERIPQRELSDDPNVDPYVLRAPRARFSRGVRHLARELGNRLVGLALGSGAARGLAHIGILRVLEQENILVDAVAGNSMGALIAAAWAIGKNADEMEEIARRIKGRGMLRLLDPMFPRGGLLRGDKLRKFLRDIYGDKTFAQTLLPLRMSAVNLETLEQIVFDEGSLVDAVRASASIPGVFLPVYRDGQAIIDGGILNPVPIDLLARMGCSRIIAVNTVPGPEAMRANVTLQRELAQLRQLGHQDFAIEMFEAMTWKSVYSPLDVIMRAMHAMQNQLAEAACKKADLTLTPILPGSAWYEFYEPEKFIRKGEETAAAKREALRQIAAPAREPSAEAEFAFAAS